MEQSIPITENTHTKSVLIKKRHNKTEISHFVTEQVFFLSINLYIMQICLIALQDNFLAGKCLHEFFSNIVHALFLAVTTPLPPSLMVGA